MRNASLATSSLALLGYNSLAPQTHILSLSFDDGFKKSFYQIAKIHENYGLKACLSLSICWYSLRERLCGNYCKIKIRILGQRTLQVLGIEVECC